ncbi:hypothetical protein IC619_008615 [Hazenella sp. IB182353]|uniref:hypothetical protein n=1 Tax=Polycladospora coralii TaxID=2771432 RepID=UPI0017471F27|nr:hypothetical protein [Polycladospora coralii]MBS7530550.1 hypothetical protein [Polycladospora coralii]
MKQLWISIFTITVIFNLISTNSVSAFTGDTVIIKRINNTNEQLISNTPVYAEPNQDICLEVAKSNFANPITREVFNFCRNNIYWSSFTFKDEGLTPSYHLHEKKTVEYDINKTDQTHLYSMLQGQTRKITTTLESSGTTVYRGNLSISGELQQIINASFGAEFSKTGSWRKSTQITETFLGPKDPYQIRDYYTATGWDLVKVSYREMQRYKLGFGHHGLNIIVKVLDDNEKNIYVEKPKQILYYIDRNPNLPN